MTILSKLRKDVSSHYPQTYGALCSTMFNTIIVPRLFECLHPTRCTIFTPSLGVFLPAYNAYSLDESKYFAVNMIVHAHKIVLNPGAGKWIKGRDELPTCITNCISNFNDAKENTAAALMQN